MSPRTVERVDDWETVPFDGGYSGLRDLASQEFSGVVTTGPTRLFMIRGTVVGILDGSIDDFEESGGNAREAPHPALPLLAVMQERSDEVRAQYYTEDTPLADVDRTLADGSFTGFVELSENVLSGDYYQVYHQGRSMSVAYVGAAERLVTDDEAFEQADDEVGIYEVRPVTIEAIDIPEPAADAGEQNAAVAADDDEFDVSTSVDDDEIDPDDAGATERDAGAANLSSDSTVSDEAGATESEPRSPAAADEPGEPDESPDPTVDESGATASESTEEPTSTPTGEPTSTPTEEPTSTPTEEPTSTPTEEPTPEPVDERSSAPTERTPSTRSGADTTESTEERTSPSSRESSSSAQSGPEDEASPTESARTEAEADDAHPGATASSSGTDSGSPERSSPNQPSTTGDQGGRSQEPSTDSQAGRGAGDAGQRSSPTGSDQAPDTDPTAAEPQSNTRGPDPQSGGRRSDASASAGSAAALEMRSIPSLDPTRTKAASKVAARRDARARDGGTTRTSTPQRSQQGQGQPRASQQADQPSTGQGARPRNRDESGQSDQQQSETPPSRQESPKSGQTPTNAHGDDQAAAPQRSDTDDDASELARELESRQQELQDLRTDLERVEAERDELEAANAELEAERDRLQAELDEALAEIERLDERLDDVVDEGVGTAATQLSAAEAIDDTNLFVRYDSKGDATLETAHSGTAQRDEVEANMRLEYHTQFDADDAVVGNESFDDFLTGTIQYRFVDWVVRSLLYEVRDTGHADGMADLYNALPKIDRAELNGQVTVSYTEDGEEHRSQERFDVVVRDRMGNPLLVANINDSRDPATDAMMTDLIKRAERVGESSDSLAGAFLVTESFFQPEALETAEGATSSGLFSRDKRKSFVNLSRKDGYHLCLVEARNQEFHLAVPEL